MTQQKITSPKTNSLNSIILLLFLSITINLNAQLEYENIDIPSGNGGGSVIGDIIEANGKIFAYAADGISIYNASTNAFIEKIYFPETVGKFNPVYSNERLHVPDQSLMVYNNEPNHKYVYALTPKLKLLVINTEQSPLPPNNHNYWITSLRTGLTGENYLDTEFDSQDSRVILRYDNDDNNPIPANRHHRLYVLANSRDKNDNETGNFHHKKTIFGIYNIDYTILPNTEGHTTLHYVDKQTSSEYGDQINNYVFNEENNYFYLVRLGLKDVNVTPQISTSIIEIKNITSSGVSDINTIQFENIGGTNWFKMGKVLYINESGVHKIIVLPYRYFTGTVPNPRFCVIDGDDNTVKYFNSPSKRITDALFLSANNDLVLTYSPNNDEIVPALYEDTHTFIFRYDDTNDDFVPFQYFTNDNSTVTTTNDLNTSFYLTRVNSTTALINRKDGIDRIQYNGTSYTYSNLYNAEGNSFGKGVTFGNKSFVNNTVVNGLEVLNTDGSINSHMKTGYPVYHCVANYDGTKMMYYNNLNTHNTGLYSYIPQSGALNHINISSAIGDVIYNPFQDHFLISKFEPNDAKIIVVNASNFSMEDPISLPSGEFAKEMFISPQGRLYVMSDMQYDTDPDINPVVNILDATTPQYNSISSTELQDFDIYNSISEYYSANFNYNPHDQMVYAVVNVQEKKLQPYNTVASSIFFAESSNPNVPPGKILVLSDIIEKQLNLSEYPSKVICPANYGGDYASQYYGKLFVSGHSFYTYNYLNPPTSSSGLIESNHHFIDIAYSQRHDQLFGVKENTITSEHRIFEIWTINISEEGEPEFALFNINGMPVDGQIANMFSNPYDGRIYVYQKVDAEKLGNGQVSLYSFDPDNPSWESTPLGFATYFPDYDHTRDLAMFFMNNRTTPYINPYTNSIYLPNGGHSSVSKVNFTPADQLNLDAGLNWISIPRHEGNGSSGNYDPWPTNTVFHKDNFENSYSRLQLDYYDPYGSTPVLRYATYDIPAGMGWNYSGDMEDSYSYRGYKIQLFQTTYNTLELTGVVENPYTTIDLVDEEENWVGYFLFQEQDIFDAVADYESQLMQIKHQDFTCTRLHQIIDGQPVALYPWYCNKLNTNISYGEMVVLKPIVTIENFSWNYAGNPPIPLIDEELQYYSYTETADYSALVVELDSTENPVELAAFVNDSCIGANTVLPEDSAVVIQAYLGDQPGDSVVFEEHFGTKSTERNRIDDYFVLNQKTMRHENRTIKTGENKSVYYISLKNKKLLNNNKHDFSFSLYPNPADDNVNIEYYLNERSGVNLSVYDGYGRLVTTLLNIEQPEGNYSFTWNPASDNNKKIKKGLYIIKLSINDNKICKKLVIN